MNDFHYTTQISQIKDPLDWTPEKVELMILACREMAQFHLNNNQVISKIYKKYNFSPEDIKTEEDLSKIPFIGVTAMKYHLLHTMPEKHLVLKLTSSGTKGQKTQIWFDKGSLDRVQRMLDVYLEQENIVSNIPQNYLVFNYNPEDAGDLGTAYTEKNQLRFAPVNNVFYCINKDSKNKWEFNKEKALELLSVYEKDNVPTRIFGMPAFLFEFIDWMKKKGIKIKLPKNSMMMTGGGWKAAEDKKISREEFRTLCFEAFGVERHWQRDAFGMAEHCAPYFQCKHHRFHIPVFNRIICRHPISLEALPPGETGLMELITPFNAMMPTLALLSTDWAKVDKEKCTCGFNSMTFTLQGRAGVSKHKGCAITADEIVKRSRK